MFHSFDPVTVRLSLDQTNIQHEKLVFQLITPFIEGFSIESVKETDQCQGEKGQSKRKKQDSGKTGPCKKK